MKSFCQFLQQELKVTWRLRVSYLNCGLPLKTVFSPHSTATVWPPAHRKHRAFEDWSRRCHRGQTSWSSKLKPDDNKWLIDDDMDKGPGWTEVIIYQHDVTVYACALQRWKKWHNPTQVNAMLLPCQLVIWHATWTKRPLTRTDTPTTPHPLHTHSTMFLTIQPWSVSFFLHFSSFFSRFSCSLRSEMSCFVNGFQ